MISKNPAYTTSQNYYLKIFSFTIFLVYSFIFHPNAQHVRFVSIHISEEIEINPYAKD